MHEMFLTTVEKEDKNHPTFQTAIRKITSTETIGNDFSTIRLS